MSPFRHLLHDHRLWGIRRRNVVPAAALGVFLAFMPFPGHPLWASLAALALRINIPVAAVVTFISNPLTMGPMYFAAYRIGAMLLAVEPQPFRFSLSFDWVTETFVNIWQPMLLGSVLLGAGAGLVTWTVLDVLWRSSVARYKAAKQRGRTSTTD